MTNVAGFIVFVGVVILSITMGSKYDAYTGWTVLGSGIILIGIVEAIMMYKRGEY